MSEIATTGKVEVKKIILVVNTYNTQIGTAEKGDITPCCNQ